MRLPFVLVAIFAACGALPARAVERPAVEAIRGKWTLDRSAALTSSEGFKQAIPEEQKKLLEAFVAIPTATLEITDATLAVTVDGGSGKKETQAARYEVESVAGHAVRIVRHPKGGPSEGMSLEVTDADALLLSSSSQDAGDPPLPLRRLVDPGRAAGDR